MPIYSFRNDRHDIVTLQLAWETETAKHWFSWVLRRGQFQQAALPKVRIRYAWWNQNLNIPWKKFDIYYALLPGHRYTLVFGVPAGAVPHDLLDTPDAPPSDWVHTDPTSDEATGDE